MDDYKILVEIFGYIGTALVIVSMMMTSLLKLRIINILGSVISLIYSLICNTWPIVIMNLCLILINVFQIIKQYNYTKNIKIKKLNQLDQSILLFIDYHKEKINELFSQYLLDLNKKEIFAFYNNYQIVGIIIGTKKDNIFNIEIMYFEESYKYIINKNFLLDFLLSDNISLLSINKFNMNHIKKLEKLGFNLQNNSLIKEIKTEAK